MCSEVAALLIFVWLLPPRGFGDFWALRKRNCSCWGICNQVIITEISSTNPFRGLLVFTSYDPAEDSNGGDCQRSIPLARKIFCLVRSFSGIRWLHPPVSFSLDLSILRIDCDLLIMYFRIFPLSSFVVGSFGLQTPCILVYLCVYPLMAVFPTVKLVANRKYTDTIFRSTPLMHNYWWHTMAVLLHYKQAVEASRSSQ